MNDKRYVGITGLRSRDEVNQLLNKCPMKFGSNPLLMLGVLVSSKTMQGEKTKYPLRYPTIKDVTGIFPDDPNCLNLIHFHPETQVNLHQQMIEVMKIGGRNCHGIQLNTKWPNKAALRLFRQHYPNAKIVLQVGAGAQALFADPTSKVVDITLLIDAITEYYGLVNYVLIDPSGGKGEAMDEKFTDQLLTELHFREVQKYIAIGIAGGISAENFYRLTPWINRFNVSTDGEGQFRNAQDELLIEKAIDYINQGMQIPL